jgi:Flp pilus assembly protein TadB
MDRDRKAGVLLLIAAAAFLVSALLSEPRQPLSFVAAAALLLAGILRFRRSRRS